MMNAPDHMHITTGRALPGAARVSRGVAVLLLLFLVVAALPGMTILKPAHPGLAVAVEPAPYPDSVATTKIDRLLSRILLDDDQLTVEASLGADLQDYVQQVTDSPALAGDDRVSLVIRKSLPEPAAGQLIGLLDSYLEYRDAVPDPLGIELDRLEQIQTEFFGEADARRLFGPYNQMRRMMEGHRDPAE